MTFYIIKNKGVELGTMPENRIPKTLQQKYGLHVTAGQKMPRVSNKNFWHFKCLPLAQIDEILNAIWLYLIQIGS
jgi:hypothetical protein